MSTGAKCGHRLACTYGKVDYKRQLCQVWWCHKCGALAIRRSQQGGRPARRDWWYVVGRRKPATA